MAHKHQKKDGFPIAKDKLPGIPCENLRVDSDEDVELYTCKIYGSLSEKGWKVCPEFTCHGAGQAVSAFFKELGVSWAEEKPEKYSQDEWRMLKINQRYGYQALQNVFSFLNGLEKHYGDEVYMAARAAVERVAPYFSVALQQTDREIDPNYWVKQRFDPEIRAACVPLLPK
jgi:hypothetical protein